MHDLLRSRLAKVSMANANIPHVPPIDVLKLHEHGSPCIPVKAAHLAKMPKKKVSAASCFHTKACALMSLSSTAWLTEHENNIFTQ